MAEQARARNAIAIRSGRVELQPGSVDNLPFRDDSFDKSLAQAFACRRAPAAAVRQIRCGALCNPLRETIERVGPL